MAMSFLNVMLTIVLDGRDEVEESCGEEEKRRGCLYALVLSNPICVLCFFSRS